jgi:hypothetical protein
MACWIKLGLEETGIQAMRIGVTLAFFIATNSAAFAGGGFEIVIPGRPGVPVIINGVDASYAVVEGDWGLGKGTHVQPTVYGGRYVDPVPHVGRYYPSAGRMPGYGRLEIEPPANRRLPQPAESYHQPQIAAAGRELSSILVGAVGAAAGAIERPRQSAGDHLRAGL